MNDSYCAWYTNTHQSTQKNNPTTYYMLLYKNTIQLCREILHEIKNPTIYSIVGAHYYREFNQLILILVMCDVKLTPTIG